MITQFDLKFKGDRLNLELFINDLYENFNNLIIYDFDEINSFQDIVKIVNKSDYIYLSANLSYLILGDMKISDVFFDLRKENDIINILFFFDLNQFNYSVIKILDILEINSNLFMKKYKFDSFECTIDNGNANEIIFNEKGKGIYYKSYLK